MGDEKQPKPAWEIPVTDDRVDMVPVGSADAPAMLDLIVDACRRWA